MAKEIESIIALPEESEAKEYHLASASKICPMRIMGMINLDYIEIDFDEVNARRLNPCKCNFVERD